MIKFALRPNLKYPLQLLLYNELRNTESTLVSKYLQFSDSLVLTPLMFIGECVSGFIIYIPKKISKEKYI